MDRREIGVDDLTQERSATIGFVVAALFAGAIDVAELRAWALSVVERLDADELPPYLFELLDLDGPPSRVYTVIGFTPEWNASSAERQALVGIALRRGRTPGDAAVGRERARRLVDELPSVAETFERVFPHLSTSWRTSPSAG